MKVAIIGAGAGGLMCAGHLVKRGFDVTVFDKNEKAGKKLYITGKGRCNFTNASIGESFSSNIVRGQKFMISALNQWNSFDTIKFFENLGMKTKVERGNRAFPESDKSSDVLKALLKHANGAKFVYGSNVLDVYSNNGFVVVTDNGRYDFDAVVIATGGRSYEATGSTGDGYKFAKKFGHSIVDIRPALVAMKLKNEFVKDLQGLSLKNVALKAVADGKKFEEFGEMLFTDCGISGPIVLTLSSKINRAKEISLSLDFKPALTEEKLGQRILREFDLAKNKNISSVMKTLLPNAFIKPFLKVCNIAPEQKINSITSQQRQEIVKKLKKFDLHFAEFYSLNSAIITSGGVDTKQINPKTMESKIVKNLYFVGEVLDVDALTGGFNLQIAFSTAVACAENMN